MTSHSAFGSLPARAEASPNRRLVQLAWVTLGYTLLVILFGAVVRITGSGAGCGQHWPTCQGEVVALPKTIETAIELTHRLTSGLSLLLVVALFVVARRRLAPGHSARFWAGMSVVFMVVESLIGAALVLLELVGNNTSLARAVVMSLHLVNTSLLLATLALTAWTAADNRLGAPAPGTRWLVLLALFGVLLVSLTGAVTALGDTLYPAADGSAHARLLADQAPGAHFLQRLRIVHPVLACGVALYVATVAPRIAAASRRPSAESVTSALRLLVVAQVGAGFLNVRLSAPGWLQVVHLALASLLWVSLVLLAAESRAEPVQAPN